jgi:hypothetical protein
MKNKISTSFIFSVFIIFCNSQENNELQVLMNIRDSLIQNDENLISIEQQIASVGVFPPAYVHQSTDLKSIQFIFTCYKLIPSEKEHIFEQRFELLFPEVELISITNQAVTVRFPINTSNERINEFFNVFGYSGYTLSKF